MMIGIYVLFYIVCVAIFAILFWYVTNNEGRYNRIPEKYNRSVWYIGDSKTSYSKRSKHYIRESVFLLVSIVTWFVLLMIVFVALHIFRIRGIGSYVELSSMGLYGSATVSLFLSVFYSNIFLLSNNSFCVSMCMYRAKDSRGNFLKREMLVCLVATVLLMPFALLGTDNYVYVTEEAVYENTYFSWGEEAYRYDENTVLQIEKKYNDAHSLSSLRCYMKNEKKRFNILNNDLGMDMIRTILEESPMQNAKLEGDIPVSKQEAEKLMANSHDNLNKVVYRWFLYEYMGVEK